MKKITLILALFTALISLTACHHETESGPMILGNSSADILIEEFSDVECPACGQISPQVEEVVRNNSDIVRLHYYHFPLSYHEQAFPAAEATLCADDQSKGFEYLGELFTNSKNLGDDYFTSLAESMGLNMEQFNNCMDNHEKKAVVQSHQREGKARQIPGTPSIFVNGEMVKWPGVEAFEAYLKSL